MDIYNQWLYKLNYYLLIYNIIIISNIITINNDYLAANNLEVWTTLPYKDYV